MACVHAYKDRIKLVLEGYIFMQERSISGITFDIFVPLVSVTCVLWLEGGAILMVQ